MDLAEGYQINAGIVGGPVPSDALNPDGTPNATASHFDTIDQLNAAQQKTSVEAGLRAAWNAIHIPWWVWGLGTGIVLAFLLHEANPTISLIAGARK